MYELDLSLPALASRPGTSEAAGELSFNDLHAKTKFTGIEVGEEWAYAHLPCGPLARATIIELLPGKFPKVVVELDAGDTQTVTAAKLRVLWSNADAYRDLTGRWSRLRGKNMSWETSRAVAFAFETVRRSTAIRLSFYHGENVTVIADVAEASALTGLSESDLTGDPDSFVERGELFVPKAVTLAIAEALARRHPVQLQARITKRIVDRADNDRRWGITRTVAEKAAGREIDLAFQRTCQIVRGWAGLPAEAPAVAPDNSWFDALIDALSVHVAAERKR